MTQVIDIEKTGKHLKDLCRQNGITVIDIQKALYHGTCVVTGIAFSVHYAHCIDCTVV